MQDGSDRSGERLTLQIAPDALTVHQAAELLGISPNLMYDSLRRGEIRGVRIGTRWIIPKAVIARLLGVGGDPSRREDR